MNNNEPGTKEMKNKLVDVMSERTDEQLKEVIESTIGDYDLETVEAAKQEIKRRELNKVLTKGEEIEASNEHYEQDYMEVTQPTQSIAAESELEIIATVVIASGTIVSIALLIFGINLISNYDKEFGFAIIFLMITILLLSVVVWGLLRVLCNISINIKEIKEKLKNK